MDENEILAVGKQQKKQHNFIVQVPSYLIVINDIIAQIIVINRNRLSASRAKTTSIRVRK